MYLLFVHEVNLIWHEIFYDPGGACGTYREEEKYLRVLVGKSEGSRLFGILRCRWEDNIKIYY
jgi:hypothetical protein